MTTKKGETAARCLTRCLATPPATSQGPGPSPQFESQQNTTNPAVLQIKARSQKGKSTEFPEVSEVNRVLTQRHDAIATLAAFEFGRGEFVDCLRVNIARAECMHFYLADNGSPLSNQTQVSKILILGCAHFKFKKCRSVNQIKAIIKRFSAAIKMAESYPIPSFQFLLCATSNCQPLGTETCSDLNLSFRC